MNAKEYLSRPYQIKKKIRYLELEKERYLSMTQSVSSQQFDKERVDGSRPKDTPNQRALEKYYETQDKIEAQLDELSRVTEEITNTIDKLEDEDSKLVIKYHYLDNLTWDEIADKLFISNSTVRRLHRVTLQNIKIT